MNIDLITIGLMGLIWLWVIRDIVMDAIKTYYREKLNYMKELTGE